jgi:hypothetical protein
MARTKTVAELTVEQQIAQIQKEAAEKIKQLQTALPWNKRFKTAFDKYLIGHKPDITRDLTGYKPDDNSIEHDINIYLSEVNLSVKYSSATFDNDLYHNSSNSIDAFDLSEYPVYTVYTILENKEVVGHVKINCLYSSYNGNEYNCFSFVQPKQITCTVFTAYNP